MNIDIKKTLKTHDRIKELVSLFDGKNSTFILGKGKGESIAKEGSLKIKEVSYIHAEGYSTSSLKHGPFALLEKDFPVVLLSPFDEYYSKTENAYEEIKNICINLQKDTSASNLEVKCLLKLIMKEWDEKKEQKTGFGFR